MVSPMVTPKVTPCRCDCVCVYNDLLIMTGKNEHPEVKEKETPQVLQGKRVGIIARTYSRL